MQRQLQMIPPLTEVFKEFQFEGLELTEEQKAKLKSSIVSHLGKAICRGLVEPFTYYLFTDLYKDLEKGGPDMDPLDYALALDARLRDCAIPTTPGAAADVKPSGVATEVRLTFSEAVPRIRVQVRPYPDKSLVESLHLSASSLLSKPSFQTESQKT